MAVYYRVLDSAQYGIIEVTTRCTKGGCKLDGGRRMPGAGLSRRSSWKAPLGKPAFQPYWGKLPVRNDRGDRGNVGIIRSPIRASILPDLTGLSSPSVIALREQQRNFSLDHLVGKQLQLSWDVETKRLGRCHIDDELEFGRLHHRQVGGLGALEDAAGIDADLTIRVREVGSVAHQPAGCDNITGVIGRRNLV